MPANYQFTIHTGDQSGAGTDANIFIVLYGERGETDEVRLNGYISGDAFERNQTDVCVVPFSEDVGNIYKIRIRSDQRYAASDWLLNRLEVCAVIDAAKGLYRPKSTFRIAEWIKDEQPHEKFVSDGYMRDYQVKEDWVVVSGAPQIILGNTHGKEVQQQTITVKTSGKTSLAYAKEDVTSISTKATVSGKFDVVKTTLETAFKTEFTHRTDINLESELSFEHDYVIRIGPGEPERELVEKWAERRKKVQITLGDSALPDVHAVVEKRFVGLADPTTDKLLMKVDSGVPVVESAPAAAQLAWASAH